MRALHWLGRQAAAPSTLVALALLALVAYATTTRLVFLLEGPRPLGVDGYYYAVQLRSLLDGDGLYYPSAPAALALMLPFARIFPWLFSPAKARSTPSSTIRRSTRRRS